MFLAFLVFPIIYFLFMFFCCVYSGIMMFQIKEAMNCDPFVKVCIGMEMKYLIMAIVCSASSLAMLVMSIIATPIIFRRMREETFYEREYGDVKKNIYCCYTTFTFIFFIPVACGFFANLFFIPCTIFIKYKKERTYLIAQY